MKDHARLGLSSGFAGSRKYGSRAGFTLVELLIALVIVSILAAVAVPGYTSKVRQGRQVDAQRILMSLAQTEEIFRFQNGSYTNDTAVLAGLGWVNDSAKKADGTLYYPTANINIVPTAPPNPTFVATIFGNIGKAGVNDTWTINENGTLTNTVKGY